MNIPDLDKECVKLCEAMNLFRGVETTSSCCGHGRDRYIICFEAVSLKVLPPLLFWFGSCHCGFSGWQVRVHTDCGMGPAYFTVEKPVSPQTFEESETIAQLMVEYLLSKDGRKHRKRL